MLVHFLCQLVLAIKIAPVNERVPRQDICSLVHYVYRFRIPYPCRIPGPC